MCFSIYPALLLVFLFIFLITSKQTHILPVIYGTVSLAVLLTGRGYCGWLLQFAMLRNAAIQYSPHVNIRQYWQCVIAIQLLPTFAPDSHFNLGLRKDEIYICGYIKTQFYPISHILRTRQIQPNPVRLEILQITQPQTSTPNPWSCPGSNKRFRRVEDARQRADK